MAGVFAGPFLGRVHILFKFDQKPKLGEPDPRQKGRAGFVRPQRQLSPIFEPQEKTLRGIALATKDRIMGDRNAPILAIKARISLES